MASTASNTHYETLGVARDASRSEITAAFRAQMRALHSDAGGDDELAKHVSSAYNVLSNPSRRAKYDHTLGPESRAGPPATSSSPHSDRPAPGATRHRIFLPEHGVRTASMLDVDPSQWHWSTPAEGNITGASERPRRRRHVRIVLLMVAFVAWAAAGAAAATTLGLPLARIGALSTPLALLWGVGAHLAWSLLTVTRSVFRRWGLLVSLALAAAAAVDIYLDAGTPLPVLGSTLCLLASLLTTYASFGAVLSGPSRDSGVIDSSFITQLGATSLGSHNADIDQLLGALTGAFGHRKGVRVILLPDRVTPRPGVSPVRAQAAVVVGRSVHLIAIPPLGADGLEISRSEIISDGLVHRNVVRDEVQALHARYRRTAGMRGYIVPTKLAVAPDELTHARDVSFGSLTQVIDAIATDAGPSLDKTNSLFPHRAVESMAMLL